jgi:hypothetical protein
VNLTKKLTSLITAKGLHLKHWLYSNTTPSVHLKNKQNISKCFILPTKFQYSKTMIHFGEKNAAINIC